MAPYAPSTSLISPGRIGRAGWYDAISKHADPTESGIVVGIYHDEAPKLGLNPDLAIAQAIVECAWFTSDLWRQRRNPCGLGITGAGVLGKDYGTVRNGITAHLHHLCCYAYTLATCPVQHVGTPDPRHDFHDGNPRLSHLQEPPPGRQWATGPAYVAKILAVANALLLAQEDGMAPTIEQHLTPVNHWEGRSGNPVEAIVVHVSEGGKAGVESWFKNPASEASAHYLVNKDGTIWQFVKEADTAWANGIVNAPNMDDPLIAGWVNAGVNPNRRTISIETERQWTERLTVPQLASLAWLCADIHARYTLPTDGSRLLGHNEIDSVNRAHCPSLSAAEWSVLVKGLSGATPAPAPAMQSPIITPAHTWGGKGRVISLTLVARNDDEGQSYSAVLQDDVQAPWVKV